MIINLHLNEVPANEFARGYFLGESSQLCINSNNKEISSMPIEFFGSTREEVIAQVRAYARHKFPSGGKIRII